AQLARHRIEGWKQAFRLDKKLLYKFERPQADPAAAAAPGAENETAHNAETEAKSAKKDGKGKKPGKAEKGGKGARGKSADKAEETASTKAEGPVKLHVRLAFSGHEKMTEERWVKRIPEEEPFSGAAPETVKPNDAGFAEKESQFEALE